MMDGKKVKLRIKKFRYVFPAKFSMLYAIPHIVREFTNLGRQERQPEFIINHCFTSAR